jgi:hypothetical protein
MLKNSRRQVTRYITLSLLLLTGTVPYARSQVSSSCPLQQTVTLNFDTDSMGNPISIPSLQTVDATSYLSSFGVTFVPITPGATPVIQNATPSGPGEAAAIPVSAPNIFAVNSAPGQSNASLSYELQFCSPLNQVSFYRTCIISISTGPAWTASALNAQGQIVDSASEGVTLGPAARLITLKGAGITALRIDAENQSSTFTDPPIDNLTLVPFGQSLGGLIANNNASCAAPFDGTGQIICAVRGTDTALYAIRFNPRTGFMTSYQALGGRTVGDPSCASPNDASGQVICAVKGTDSALYGIAFNPQNGFKTGYQSLGGTIADNPSCAAPIDGTGQVICAVKGPDNALYGIRFNPRTGFTTAYQYLGGTIEDSPSCASPNNGGVGGQVICGVKARDSALYGIQFDPGTGFATGYQYLGGTLQDRPSCAVGNGGSNVNHLRG